MRCFEIRWHRSIWPSHAPAPGNSANQQEPLTATLVPRVVQPKDSAVPQKKLDASRMRHNSIRIEAKPPQRLGLVHLTLPAAHDSPYFAAFNLA
jgi:hypothetical protein